MSDNNKGLFEELEKISERINENLEGFYEITKKLKDSMPNLTEEFKKMNEEAGKLSEISKEIKISIKNETDFSTVMGTLASIATTITFAKSGMNEFLDALNKTGAEKVRQIGTNITGVSLEAKKSEKELNKVDKMTSKLSGFKFGGIGSMDTAVELGMKLFEVFSNLMSNNEDFAAKMNELWAKITEALKPVMEAVKSLFDSFTVGGEGSCSMMDTIAETVGMLAKTLAGVIEGISGLFKEHGDSIMSVVSAIGTFVSEIADMLVDVLGGAFDIITGIFSGNGEKIKEGFGDIWKGIKKIFAGFGDFFGGLWDKVVGIFKKIGTKIGDAIGGSFKSIINSIIGFAENTINGLIKQINNAIALINEIPGVKIAQLKLLNIPKLELGGMVTPGQLFIARERGPELVGSFGRHAAVMNNNQIVEAVSDGVFRAMNKALNNNSNGGSYTFNINNHLDGREIGRQVIKYHNGLVKQYGHSPLII